MSVSFLLYTMGNGKFSANVALKAKMYNKVIYASFNFISILLRQDFNSIPNYRD